MSVSPTEPGPQDPTVYLPTHAQMYAKIAAYSEFTPAARKADEDALRARIEAAIEAARVPWEKDKHREKVNSEGDLGDDDGPDILALNEPAPSPAPADGLKTSAQAARRLGISIRTLRGLVSSGELRYVNVGRGKQREKTMFTDNDLGDLIAKRTRQKAQELCPSTSQRARPSITSTSSGEIIAFTALRSERIAAKRKP